MTQDFARKKTRNSTKTKTKQRATNRKKPVKSQKAPAWAWLLIGLLLSALVTLLVYISNRSPATAPAQVQASAPEKPTTEPQPRFDFYEILKEREVEVPDRSAEIQAATPQNIEYILQAGSFRNTDDAETLKAELLLANLPVTVEPVSTDTGTWHRVMVGPFSSRSKMAKARSTLASKQLSPILRKRTID